MDKKLELQKYKAGIRQMEIIFSHPSKINILDHKIIRMSDHFTPAEMKEFSKILAK